MNAGANPGRHQVAPGIYRLGTRYVNCYLIEEAGALTLVDTGPRGYWSRLLDLLARLGRSLTDVHAVLITHHHPDHRGNAGRLEALDTAVYAHPSDHAYVRGERRMKTAGTARFLWRPWYMRYITHLVRNGVLAPQNAAALNDLTDGETLHVPGSPRVLHVPGHTAGSCALHLDDRRVLLSGDALVTLDTARGRRGPCILTGPFTDDQDEALASLGKLAAVPADVMLPGHGEPWTQGLGAAVEAARRRAGRP